MIDPRRACWAAAALLLLPPAAGAHQLKIFAAGEGRIISGYVYVVGAGRVGNVDVLVLGPGGVKLATVRADAKGEFAYKAAAARDYTFVVETSEGHRATFTVSADEIAGRAQPSNEPTPTRPRAAALDPVKSDAANHTHDLADPRGLADMVDKAVARRIRPLQERLQRFEDRRRLADVIGGIGYIFGIMGMILYFKSRSRR